MRLSSFHAVTAAAVAWSCAACGPALTASNGTKMGEALAFAAVAGAAQVAQSAIEQNARNNAPVRHASMGLTASPDCDNGGQYPCVSVTPATGAPAETDTEMSVDEARDYVLGYVNGVRKLNGVGWPVTRDPPLDAFADAGSDQLAQDHRPHQHMTDHAAELPGAGEVQGSKDGTRPGPLEDQLASVLLGMMGEGPGGMHHDLLLRPEWRRLGVGIVTRDGRTYVTVDFTR